MRIKLPSEATGTAIVIGGAFVVAGTSLSAMTVAAWIGAYLMADGYLLVIPLLPVLISIGPGILGGAMFLLPKRADVWKAGLWTVSVISGWSLMAIALSADLPIHSNLGWVAASLLFALVGLLVIFSSASHTVAPLDR